MTPSVGFRRRSSDHTGPAQGDEGESHPGKGEDVHRPQHVEGGLEHQHGRSGVGGNDIVAGSIYDDRYNGWYDDYDEDGYDDYDDYDDYAEYDDYEDYDDYDDYDDRYDDDRDGYRNNAYGRDAPPGREDLARDPGSWDDLIDGPLWPEGEDPLTGRPRTGESRRTERGRRP